MAGKDVVILTGMKETLDALSKFDREAVKKFEKVINDELRRGKADAKKIVVVAVSETGAPLSHWQTEVKQGARTKEQAARYAKTRRFPVWNTAEVVAGITSSRSPGKVRGDYTTSAGALINNSRAGAIFEIAGRVPGGGTNSSGTAFKKQLNEKHGRASRVVWSIVDRDRLRFQADIVKALDEAKATLQKELNKRQSK
jgi:galactose mutarotase-like enzyme